MMCKSNHEPVLSERGGLAKINWRTIRHTDLTKGNTFSFQSVIVYGSFNGILCKRFVLSKRYFGT
jgi:hypothetical protein